MGNKLHHLYKTQQGNIWYSTRLSAPVDTKCIWIEDHLGDYFGANSDPGFEHPHIHSEEDMNADAGRTRLWGSPRLLNNGILSTVFCKHPHGTDKDQLDLMINHKLSVHVKPKWNRGFCYLDFEVNEIKILNRLCNIQNTIMSITANFLVYKLKYDTNVAPCVHKGLLSIAMCQPDVRHAAKVNDFIIILAGTHLAETTHFRKDEVIYVIKVTEVLPLKEFCNAQCDGRFDRSCYVVATQYPSSL